MRFVRLPHWPWRRIAERVYFLTVLTAFVFTVYQIFA